MSLTVFDDGYYYATELKTFARSLGVSGASRLRKDQLEELIREYLRAGQLPNRLPTSPPSTAALAKDSDQELTLETPIRRYTNDDATKSFLFGEARRANPHFKQKSGAMYWINRWREDQLANGIPLTYGDLVHRFVKLNQTSGRLPRIPSTKYNNFVSDYLAGEPGATRTQAVAAWDQVKAMSVPKTYAAWKSLKEDTAKTEDPNDTGTNDAGRNDGAPRSSSGGTVCPTQATVATSHQW